MAPVFEYIQCDIPEGVTIREWRQARVQQPRRRRLRVMVSRARRGIGFWSGRRATRMSTRVPRKGTPSSSSSARWRSPLASEPSARTTRHHGTSSSVWLSTVPPNRGAPGEMSPYERTKPSGISRTRARTTE
jgi:hypothetical protein